MSVYIIVFYILQGRSEAEVARREAKGKAAEETRALEARHEVRNPIYICVYIYIYTYIYIYIFIHMYIYA